MADRPKELESTPINVTGAGTHTLVAAESGYRIAMVAIALFADGAITATLQDQTTSLIDLYLAASAGIVLPECTGGWLITEASESLDIALLADGVNVVGRMVYRKVPAGWTS